MTLAENLKRIVGPRAVRVGIVGTGYIADFHANAIQKVAGVDLVSVCDQKLGSATAFASNWKVASVYNSADGMVANERLDAIHILVPPDLHYSIASSALEAGVNVFLEKPMCVSPDEASKLVEIARKNDRLLAVNHNMLFTSAYQRLRQAVHSGDLGPLNHLSFNFFQEVGQIRFGPFNSWMLRAPGNLALEIGPHVFSALLDLVGPPVELLATADRSAEIPGAGSVFRRWRVRTLVKGISADVNMNFGPAFTSRTISVYGLFGSAIADLDANTCVIDQGTTLGIDLDRYSRTKSVARQLASQARGSLLDYALSKLKLRNRGNPYQTTIIDSVAAFYSSIVSKTELDSRIDGSTSGAAVVDLCCRVIDSAGVNLSIEPPTNLISKEVAVTPTVLVLGARGFIGSELVTQLLAAGYSVRAMVRGPSPKLEQLASDRLEIFSWRHAFRSRSEGRDDRNQVRLSFGAC